MSSRRDFIVQSAVTGAAALLGCKVDRPTPKVMPAAVEAPKPFDRLNIDYCSKMGTWECATDSTPRDHEPETDFSQYGFHGERVFDCTFYVGHSLISIAGRHIRGSGMEVFLASLDGALMSGTSSLCDDGTVNYEFSSRFLSDGSRIIVKFTVDDPKSRTPEDARHLVSAGPTITMEYPKFEPKEWDSYYLLRCGFSAIATEEELKSWMWPPRSFESDSAIYSLPISRFLLLEGGVTFPYPRTHIGPRQTLVYHGPAVSFGTPPKAYPITSWSGVTNTNPPTA